MHAEGAQILARYESDFYAGEPVVTRNAFGSGQAYYLASDLEPDALRAFYAPLCVEAGIEAELPQVLAGVEAVRRVSPGGESLLYVLNHNVGAVEFELPPGRFEDLLSGEKLERRVAMAGYGVRILTL